MWLTEWCLADFGNATNNYAFTFATYAQQVCFPASAAYLVEGMLAMFSLCKCIVMKICAAPTSSAQVHWQGRPEHSARRAPAWLTVRPLHTKCDQSQSAGVSCCLQALPLWCMPMQPELYKAPQWQPTTPDLQQARAPHLARE